MSKEQGATSNKVLNVEQIRSLTGIGNLAPGGNTGSQTAGSGAGTTQQGGGAGTTQQGASGGSSQGKNG